MPNRASYRVSALKFPAVLLTQVRVARVAWLLAFALLWTFSVAQAAQAEQAAASAEQTADRGTPRTYRVKKGDTLSEIASRYNLSVDDLRKKNRLKSDVLMPGQRLSLRGSASSSKGASASKSSSKRRGKSTASSKKADRSSGHKVYYKVKRGDTLSEIAKRHRTSVSQLRRWNGRKAKGIRPGRLLVVDVRSAGSGPEEVVRATQLPEKGPGYYAPRRDRVWGTPTTIRAIQTASAAVARLYPGTVPAFVGDISFHGGGYMPPHKSHRKGIDVDISYFTKGNGGDRFGGVSASTLDAEKTWSYLLAFLDTGKVESIYIEYSLQKPLYLEAKRRGLSDAALDKLFEYPAKRGTGRTKTIRHIRGHDDHFHVRFEPEKSGKSS